MLNAIGTRDNIKPWVDAALGRGERLMGFGHRIYRVRDPRADVLKAAIARLAGAWCIQAELLRCKGGMPARWLLQWHDALGDDTAAGFGLAAAGASAATPATAVNRRSHALS